MYKKKFNKQNSQEHPYFLVTPSIIPVLTSIAVTLFVTEIINFFYLLSKPLILSFSFLTLFLILLEWFWNISKESEFHTKAAQLNNKISFILFIFSEVMFFFSLFWAFFHGSLSPTIAFNNSWPPQGISVISAFGPPIWGTWVLWVSSLYALYIKDLVLTNYVWNYKYIITSFQSLIILALFFTVCQLCEFYLATFSFREGMYGSIFYLLTGFHGIHVVIGTIFLLICFFRYYWCLISQQGKTLNHEVKSGVYGLNFYNSSQRLLKLLTTVQKPKCFWKVRFRNLSQLLLFKNKLIVGIDNISFNYLTSKRNWQPYHFSGLESSIWYWQFVDIVWIFVWVIIYIWGNCSLPITIRLNSSLN